MRKRRLAVGLALVVVVSTPLAAMALGQPDDPGVRPYVVQPGDSVCGIAQRLDYKGGCTALYEANSWVIGKDPDRLQVGMRLFIHTDAFKGYVVQPGDTLPGVAARLAVPGGASALFAANKSTIGAPNRQLTPGLVLRAPATSTRATPQQPSTTAPVPTGISPGPAGPAAAATDAGAPSHRRLVLAGLVALAALGLLGLLGLAMAGARRRPDDVENEGEDPVVVALGGSVARQLERPSTPLPRQSGPAAPTTTGAVPTAEVEGLRAMLAVAPDQLPQRLAELVSLWPTDVRVERELVATYRDSLLTAVRAPATSPAAASSLPNLVEGLDRQWQILAARPAAAFDVLGEVVTSLTDPVRPLSDDLRRTRAVELAQLLGRYWDSLVPEQRQQEQLVRMRSAAARFSADWQEPSAASSEEFARARSQLLSELTNLSRSRTGIATSGERRLDEDLHTLRASWQVALAVPPAQQLQSSTRESR